MPIRASTTVLPRQITGRKRVVVNARQAGRNAQLYLYVRGSEECQQWLQHCWYNRVRQIVLLGMFDNETY